ncbi:flagellar hook-associated protein FlgK [Mahella australiensis]|uniref:Flagellar hook-associated protein 1 n=1 Tax=Mahella australiensis (strain DSM 15567 / CIP 107919 / 50-1 BON) TaxID=697281 RepID=F3ZWA6_MAHA5|nr:flagellar hook-associated protein FlgK [Mahella australiensis]AEE97515.1 flagellar hook-associated protein FlgK [Mahella australiensis 50-1 BON]
MSSTFYGLQIGKSAINLQQQALNVTAHNIANAGTPGYTRQQVISEAIVPPSTLGMGYIYGRWQVGGGADIQEIRQLRDGYLDAQFRSESQLLGQWEVRRDMLQHLEGIFNEPSETGITTVVEQFFSSLEELSKNPESMSVRALVRERGITLADTIRHVYNQLEGLQSQADQGVAITVQDINSHIEQIRDLNEQIFKYELGGTKANDLRDRRNLLVDELSKMIDITVNEDIDGHFSVKMGDKELVNHFDMHELEIEPRAVGEKLNEADVDGLLKIMWDGADITADITGGQLRGYIDIRDGIGPAAVGDQNETVGVPYYMAKWNEWAKAFVTEFNEQHKAGYGLNDATDKLFFEPADAAGWTAKDMKVSSDIDDLNNIAASATSGEPGNNGNALALLQIRDKAIAFTGQSGSFEDYINSLISTLGVDSQQAIRMVDNEQALIGQIEGKRQSISGVLLDEELMNMVKFQQSYNAAARVITAMDEMLDVLVNRVGIVGR